MYVSKNIKLKNMFELTFYEVSMSAHLTEY